MWTDMLLKIIFASAPAPIATFDSNTVKWNGKPVISWFARELFTTYREESQEGEHTLGVQFAKQHNIEIEGTEYPVIAITCCATRIFRKKRKWVNWSGDAFYDWHTSQLTIPPKGTVVGSAVETDLSLWADYDGEIPEGQEMNSGFARMIFYEFQQWDNSKDDEVPDLSSL
jgi:hypothetical protein